MAVCACGTLFGHVSSEVDPRGTFLEHVSLEVNPNGTVFGHVSLEVDPSGTLFGQTVHCHHRTSHPNENQDPCHLLAIRFLLMEA